MRPPSPLPSFWNRHHAARRARTGGLLVALLTLAHGCATWPGLDVTPAGAAADWRQFDQVKVGRFTAAVPASRFARSSGHAAHAERAAGDLERRVAAALQDTGQFTVSGPEAPGGPSSLSVGGVVTQAIPGSAAARDLGDEVAGRAEFAAVIEVREAATGRLLAAVRTDRRTWNVERQEPPPETLDEFIGETVRKLAAALAKAQKDGRFPAAQACVP